MTNALTHYLDGRCDLSAIRLARINFQTGFVNAERRAVLRLSFRPFSLPSPVECKVLLYSTGGNSDLGMAKVKMRFAVDDKLTVSRLSYSTG